MGPGTDKGLILAIPQTGLMSLLGLQNATIRFILSDLRGLTQSPSLGVILWLGEIYGHPGHGVNVRDEPDGGDKGGRGHGRCLHEWY